MPVIQLDRISKSYGKHQILRDFSLTVEEGEFLCVTGESGSGKSTLLNIIGLLQQCSSGSYTLFGEKAPLITDKKGMLLLRNKISYLFQGFALINDLSVEKNLHIALHYSGLSTQDKQTKMKEALQQVGMDGFLKHKVHQLSGGEQQRIALARIILKPSSLILADEPTGSLDADNRDKVMQILKDLHHNQKTILIVSHDPEVCKNADRVIRIEKLPLN